MLQKIPSRVVVVLLVPFSDELEEAEKAVQLAPLIRLWLPLYIYLVAFRDGKENV